MSRQDISGIKNLRAAAILTNSYVAATVIDGADDSSNVGLFNQLELYVDFTIGSLTNAILKIEFSPDGGSNYYQEVVTETTTGTGNSTVYPNYRILTATGKYRIPVAIKDQKIKVSIIGTGTVTGSSMKLDAILGVV